MNVHQTHVSMVDNVCRHSMPVMYVVALQAMLVSTAQKVKIFLAYGLQIPWEPVSHGERKNISCLFNLSSYQLF